MTRSLRLALATGAALATLAGTAHAAPFNPPAGAEVRLERVNGSNAMTVATPKGTVGLRVRTAVPAGGERDATVRVERGGKRLLQRTRELRLEGDGARLDLPLPARSAGVYRVTVRIGDRLVGKPVEYHVLPRTLRGASGAAIRVAQRALARKKYVVGRAGSFDARTGRAVLALRKRLGLARTSSWDAGLARRVARGEGAWKVRHPGHGRHVESDISLQLLALIGAGGKVERIYPTSTGAPATPTIKGSFRVYRKDYGSNALGMVHSAYFIRGYAIHGYKSVPTYNASHGCLRVPIPDALSIYNWVRFGTIVDVYA